MLGARVALGTKHFEKISKTASQNKLTLSSTHSHTHTHMCVHASAQKPTHAPFIITNNPPLSHTLRQKCTHTHPTHFQMIQLRIIESGKMQPILEWISGSKFNDALKVALRIIYLTLTN